MQFNGTFIDTPRIIGITALTMRPSGDAVQQQLYGAYRLEFSIITESNTVLLESSTFYKTENSDSKAGDEFIQEYIKLYKEIWDVLHYNTDNPVIAYPEYLAKLEESINKKSIQ